MRQHVASFLAVVVVCALAAACSPAPAGRDAAVTPAARGEYLVTITGCNDCHTPLTMGPEGPLPDRTRLLSGHPATLAVSAPATLPEGWAWAGTATNTAFAGPWGVSYAPNLTPDLETGFGIYTKDAFVNAMRSGKHMGAGRPIMPPMPWPAYAAMTDDDLGAIYDYLQTVPPVRNAVPAAVVATH